jgi:hypothetical protein
MTRKMNDIGMYTGKDMLRLACCKHAALHSRDILKITRMCKMGYHLLMRLSQKYCQYVGLGKLICLEGGDMSTPLG